MTVNSDCASEKTVALTENTVMSLSRVVAGCVVSLVCTTIAVLTATGLLRAWLFPSTTLLPSRPPSLPPSLPPAVDEFDTEFIFDATVDDFDDEARRNF